MTFLIFLIILGTLVFVHELGHFLAAKKAKVAVEEFGFGYPPRALVLGRKWGTLFTLNWIPFGGFVKILGEDYEKADTLPQSEEKNSTVVVEQSSYSAEITQEGIVESFESENLELEISDSKTGKNFTQVSKKWQATILAAGVFFNIIFAWLLFSFGFMIGLPTSAESDFGAEIKNPVLTVTSVIENSPAQKIGIEAGDKIKEISADGKILADLNAKKAVEMISGSSGPVDLKIERGNKNLDFEVIPETGLIEGKKAIGISMDMVGIISLPIGRAFIEGAKNTFFLTESTVLGVAQLIRNGIVGKADISQIAGPVGIVGLVGDARQLGFSYLITFAALISINLAIINLVPFPALDGGRIAIVAIEGITKKRINPKFIQTLNTVGFFLLIALMLIVTYRDILKLF